MNPKMDHDAAQALFNDHVDGELGAEQSAALEAHVQACESCREALDQLRTTVAGLRGLSTPPPASDILQGVQRKIRKRSRGRYFTRGFATSGYRVPYEIIALLMVLLMVVVYFGMASLQDLGAVSGAERGHAEDRERE